MLRAPPGLSAEPPDRRADVDVTHTPGTLDSLMTGGPLPAGDAGYEPGQQRMGAPWPASDFPATLDQHTLQVTHVAGGFMGDDQRSVGCPRDMSRGSTTAPWPHTYSRPPGSREIIENTFASVARRSPRSPPTRKPLLSQIADAPSGESVEYPLIRGQVCSGLSQCGRTAAVWRRSYPKPVAREPRRSGAEPSSSVSRDGGAAEPWALKGARTLADVPGQWWTPRPRRRRRPRTPGTRPVHRREEERGRPSRRRG